MNNLGQPDPAATTIAHEAHTHECRPIIDHGGANHPPVGMAEFLVFKGLRRTTAKAATRMHQATLPQAIQQGGGPDDRVPRHAFNKQWLFRQKDLEAWWKTKKRTLLAIGG